jgi:Secretion system C-terminal sorting domain
MNKGLKILFLFVLTFTIGAHAQQVGVEWVVIHFASPPTTYSADIAPLKYNKDFAFGMHLDDNSKDIYTHAFPLLNGGTISGNNYPGLFYTDGCGNDKAFKMSVSVFSFEQGVSVDGHDPNGPYADINVTWPELDEIYQNGWGVYNHGLNSSSSMDPDYSIARNHSYVKRMMQAATPGGPEMKVFVNPNGNDNFTAPAFDQDYIVAYRQFSFGVPSFNVTNYSGGDELRMGRSSLEGGNSLLNIANNMAAASTGGEHHFGATFNHSITGGAGYIFPVFQSYMETIANDFGKDGLDNVWMTTEEEILEYLMNNEVITLNKQLIGSNLIISFNGTLRTDFRFYATSLVVDADVPILSIDYEGGTNVTYNGINTNSALINLEWDGYVRVSDSANAEYYVSIAEASQNQYDWNIAYDYVSIVEPGPLQNSFHERLCNISGIIAPDGYCNCTTSLGPDTTICDGDCITLTAEDGGLIYAWNTGDSTQSITVCPENTSSYSVSVYNDQMCPAYDTIIVNVAPIPVPDAGNDTLTCSGHCITLSATGGVYFDWSTGDTTQNIVVCPEDTTTYYVTVSSQYNCSAEDSVTVNVIPSPNAYAGQDQTICSGYCTLLSATGGGTYLWNTGDTIPNIEVCPTDTSLYFVTVDSDNGCTDSDSVSVFVNPSPIPEAGNDTLICQGTAAVLTASGGTSYEWDTGDTTQSITVFPGDTTEYFVSVFNEYDCVEMDSVTVNVLTAPSISSGSDTLICEGDCATLSVVGIGSILWSTGDTVAEITVCPWITTNYWVSVTNAYGCSGSDTITVSVNPPPTPSTNNDTTVCQHYCVDLMATGGSMYVWSTGDTAQQIVVCPPEPTKYYVTVYDAVGCKALDSVTVNTLLGPELFLPPDTGVCAEGCIDLIASGSASYLWSTGQISAVINVCPEYSQYYSVTGIAQNLCTIKDSVLVQSYPIPIPDAGLDTACCLGSFVTLTANGGAYYLWNNIDTNQSISVSPLEATTYFVQVFSAEGCVAIDSVKVTTKISPEPMMWGINNAYCLNEEVAILNGYPGGGWFAGDGVDGNIFDPAEAGAGIHTVSYSLEGDNGCVGSDSVHVSIYPIPSVDLGGDTLVCNTDYFVLNAGPGLDSYLWSNGSMGQMGTYYGENLNLGINDVFVIVTKDGCTNIGEKFVEVIICNPGILEHGTPPKIELFPNPTDGIANLKIDGFQGEIILGVFNPQGIILHQETITVNDVKFEGKLDLQKLGKGMYFVRLSNDGFITGRWIIIQ